MYRMRLPVVEWKPLFHAPQTTLSSVEASPKQQGSLKDTFRNHLKHGFFHQNKVGNHHLQGNVQVYNLRIPQLLVSACRCKLRTFASVMASRWCLFSQTARQATPTPPPVPQPAKALGGAVGAREAWVVLCSFSGIPFVAGVQVNRIGHIRLRHLGPWVKQEIKSAGRVFENMFQMCLQATQRQAGKSCMSCPFRNREPQNFLVLSRD